MTRSRFLTALALLSFFCGCNRPPGRPDLFGPVAGRPGDTLSFTATAADPEGKEVCYMLSWGDATGTEWTPGYPSGMPVVLQHSWPTPGTLAVRVVAKDDAEKESEWSAVLPVPIGYFPLGAPGVPAGPTGGFAGREYDFAAVVTSPYGESLRVQFDWGDSADTSWSPPVASGSACTSSHSYVSSGTYSIRARARDRFDSTSGWSGGHELQALLGNPPAPPAPEGPASTWQHAPTTLTVRGCSSGVRVRYVLDWGDGATDTTPGCEPHADARAEHTWPQVGEYPVRARAVAVEDPSMISAWSAPFAVPVRANNAPGGVEVTYSPGRTARDRSTRFEAFAADAEGDSIAYQFDYDASGGGDLGDWTALGLNAIPGEDTHAFRGLGEYSVRVRARDSKGSVSGWSDSREVRVDTTGIVIWVWVSPDVDSGNALGSALIAMNGTDELIYVGAEDYEGKFYGIGVADGRTEVVGSALEPEEYFTGHPAFCAATGNIIVGCEDGELYAFDPSLNKKWSWPDSTEPTNIEWGVPAINGNRVYCTRDDDRLHYLTDNGGSVTYTSSCYVRGIRSNPVIDNSGQVIVVTDSGRLRVFDANLNPVWDSLLTSSGRSLLSPTLGSSGTVYIGDEAGNVYAVRPDHSVQWKTQVQGEANRIVLGNDAAYVATGSGRIYKLNIETGAAVWNVMLTGASEAAVSPILTANGLMYIHDDQDVLHCIRQADGAYLWLCNCEENAPARSPGRRGRRDFENPAFSPSIASNGDILVVGSDALYCVGGYSAATLLQSAWPKWQGGTHNTGRAGGGK